MAYKFLTFLEVKLVQQFRLPMVLVTLMLSWRQEIHLVDMQTGDHHQNVLKFYVMLETLILVSLSMKIFAINKA